MPKQQFHTTADVFAVVKPSSGGTYRCPVDGCPDAKKRFVDSKAFGRHLAFTHKIPSANHVRTATGKRGKKGLLLPELHTKFCPHCGYNIQQAEQAAVLLRSGK